MTTCRGSRPTDRRRLIPVLAALAVLLPSLAWAQGQTGRFGPSFESDCLVGQQNIGRSQDGTLAPCRATRDGTAAEIPWVQMLALEGREFCVNYGQNNTFVTGHAGGPTAGQPDANLDIPAGTVVIPLYLAVFINTVPGTAPIQYLDINGNLTGNGTSSAATAGPFNTRLVQAPVGSATTARQAYTVTGTAPTTILEVSPLPTPAANQLTTYNFVQTAPTLPIQGPASISYYNSATTTGSTFKATLCWIELPASAVQ
jgi:hypothetical protein